MANYGEIDLNLPPDSDVHPAAPAISGSFQRFRSIFAPFSSRPASVPPATMSSWEDVIATAASVHVVDPATGTDAVWSQVLAEGPPGHGGGTMSASASCKAGRPTPGEYVPGYPRQDVVNGQVIHDCRDLALAPPSRPVADVTQDINQLSPDNLVIRNFTRRSLSPSISIDVASSHSRPDSSEKRRRKDDSLSRPPLMEPSGSSRGVRRKLFKSHRQSSRESLSSRRSLKPLTDGLDDIQVSTLRLLGLDASKSLSRASLQLRELVFRLHDEPRPNAQRSIDALRLAAEFRLQLEISDQSLHSALSRISSLEAQISYSPVAYDRASAEL